MFRVLIPALVLLWSVTALGQGVVTLRPVARLERGSPVTLGDVATLSGGAEALAGVVLIESPTDKAGADGRLSVSVADVRDRLAAEPGFEAGRTALRGETCRVILLAGTAPRDPSPARPAAKPGARALGLTVRDHVESRLRLTFGVDADHLQLSFSERDSAVLDRPSAGWTVDVQPVGSSATMPMRITMYDGAGNIRDETVRVGVRILREVVRTTRALRRGSQLTAEDFEIDSAWLAPDVPYVEPAAAGTIRLRRHTGAGEMLTAGHAEQAEVVGRGEIVSVHVVSGTIVMRSPARALQAGRVGDVIQLEPLQGGGAFTAEVKAAGRVVAIAGSTPVAGDNR